MNPVPVHRADTRPVRLPRLVKRDRRMIAGVTTGAVLIVADVAGLVAYFILSFGG